MQILEKVAHILKKIPREYYLPIGVGCIGLILFVYGFFSTVYKSQPRENSQSSSFSQKSPILNKSSQVLGAQNSIKVDVEGAVANPGVYSIPTDARAQDGLIAAGGLSQVADRTWVAQHINLAVKLVDGTKIYIPSLGEVSAKQAFAEQAGSTSTTDVLGTSISQQVNINTSSASDLDNLPGIGPATAAKIISGRPYASTQDILTNKVVGAKEFEKIKDLIVAN